MKIGTGFEFECVVYRALHDLLLHMLQPGRIIYILQHTCRVHHREYNNRIQSPTKHNRAHKYHYKQEQYEHKQTTTTVHQSPAQTATPDTKVTNLKFKHSQKGNSARCHLSHPLFYLVHRSIQQNHGYSILFSQQM